MITGALRTTLSKLHIAKGVVRVSVGMVGILLHSCAEREPRRLTISSLPSQSVLSAMTVRVRMSCAGSVGVDDERDGTEADARRDQL